MKIKARVEEALIVMKEVEIEVPDDADDDEIENAIRSDAVKDRVGTHGTGWEILSSEGFTTHWKRS